MRKEDFLPEDTREATAEYRAAWTCIERIEENLMQGDLKEAAITCRNLASSINELFKLHQRKFNQDQINQIIKEIFLVGGIKL